MAYREHGMWEILDVLKRHHRGESQRRIAAATNRGRKTVRAYIREAKKLGWSKEVAPDEALASRVSQRRQPGPSPSEVSPSETVLRCPSCSLPAVAGRPRGRERPEAHQGP